MLDGSDLRETHGLRRRLSAPSRSRAAPANAPPACLPRGRRPRRSESHSVTSRRSQGESRQAPTSKPAAGLRDPSPSKSVTLLLVRRLWDRWAGCASAFPSGPRLPQV